MQDPSKRFYLYAVIVILLLITATRLMRLPGRDMHIDEVWTIWQTLGTPAQVLQWTPFDWPPLFYFIVDGWRSAVGIDPFIVRVLPVFIFLIGACCVYQIAVKLCRSRDAALLSLLAYGSLGYIKRGFCLTNEVCKVFSLL